MRSYRDTVRRRRLLPVQDIPFVGGCLSVDFVNTTGARSTHSERERLQTYGDVLIWSRRAALLTSAEARQLDEIASNHPAAARRTLSRVRKIRESLYRFLRAVTEQTRPRADDVAVIDRLSRQERQRYELAHEGSRYELRRRRSKEELDCMIWPIVASAIELLTSPEVARLKRCGECDWLFVDDSKNRSRRWCKKKCGDRVRARRHYSRRKNRRPPA